jgi:hypothetical protein
MLACNGKPPWFYNSLAQIRGCQRGLQLLLETITTTLRNKVQKQLNVSIDAKSFSPMFSLGYSVHTPIALEHFDPGFLELRRL